MGGYVRIELRVRQKKKVVMSDQGRSRCWRRGGYPSLPQSRIQRSHSWPPAWDDSHRAKAVLLQVVHVVSAVHLAVVAIDLAGWLTD